LRVQPGKREEERENGADSAARKPVGKNARFACILDNTPLRQMFSTGNKQMFKRESSLRARARARSEKISPTDKNFQNDYEDRPPAGKEIASIRTGG